MSKGNLKVWLLILQILVTNEFKKKQCYRYKIRFREGMTLHQNYKLDEDFNFKTEIHESTKLDLSDFREEKFTQGMLKQQVSYQRLEQLLN